VIGAVLLAHLVGDYILQSHWMAQEKVRRWWPAFVHGAFYTLPFLLITTDWRALLIIGGTHAVIDRYRLAKYLVWAKNWFAPVRIRRNTRPSHEHDQTVSVARFVLEAYNPPWSECKGNAGMPPSTPVWLSTWLMFIADNTVHVLINVAAIRWFG
jgi:hypothetical protein